MSDEYVENTCEDNVSEVENENQENDDKDKNDGNQDENEKVLNRKERYITHNYKYPPQLDHKGEMKEPYIPV